MKSLIVEDDPTGRLLLRDLLAPHGECHVAVNGKEAVSAYQKALEDGQPYDLVCLDIMMPEMDGHATLKEIRALEESKITDSIRGARIIMTTALDDIRNAEAAYQALCDGYLVKPVSKSKLRGLLKKLDIKEKIS